MTSIMGDFKGCCSSQKKEKKERKNRRVGWDIYYEELSAPTAVHSVNQVSYLYQATTVQIRISSSWIPPTLF